MKFLARRSDLLRELILLNGVAGHKATIPALQHLLIRADETLVLVATELDLALVTDRCKVTIIDPGATTVHAATFYALVNALPETEITISADDKSINIQAERFKSKLQALPTEDYPRIHAAEGDVATLSRATLKEAVTKVFARENDPSRYFLGGGLLELSGGVFCLMSTDSLRMSIVKASYIGADSKIVVPMKTLEQLKAMLEEGEDDIEYQRGESGIFFTVDGRVLYSNVIDGTFPDLSRITNQTQKHTVEFEREKLLGAATRVSLVSDKSKALRFTLDRGRVTLKAETAAGEAEEVLLVDGLVSGEMHLNTDHLLGFLQSVDCEQVSLSFTDGRQPMFWRSLQTEFDYLYILAPMRAS